MSNSIYAFFGPPGAGKGTLSDMCMKNLGWVQLSTGNLCRTHISNVTDIGLQIDSAIKSGKLVSDELVIDMVKEFLLEKSGSGETIILDGCPRTVVQAKILNDFLTSGQVDFNFNVVKLSIQNGKLIERLTSRCVCDNKYCQAVYSSIKGSSLSSKINMVCDRCGGRLVCRKDDRLEAIKNRLDIYNLHEQSMIDYYTGTGCSMINIDVDRPISEIFDEFKGIVGNDHNKE